MFLASMRAAIFAISGAIGIFMLFTMRCHHKNKPLGMQTFLGQVIVVSIEIFIISTQFSTILFVSFELTGPFSDLGSYFATVSRKHIKSYPS